MLRTEFACVSEATSTDGAASKDVAVEDREIGVFDDWEMDEQLRHIERVLQSVQARGRSAEPVGQPEPARRDVPHAGPPMWHMAQADKHRKPRPSHSLRTALARAFAWLMLLSGIIGFLGGLALLGWSAWAGRPDLWNIGLPATLIGQLVLLLSLSLQIHRLWRNNRVAVAKLDNVDEQLHELKNTTMLWNASHGPASNLFYTHLANGAGSQLLLNDLKSQIDLLAMKIAQDDR
jgi:hypothetical protein